MNQKARLPVLSVHRNFLWLLPVVLVACSNGTEPSTTSTAPVTSTTSVTTTSTALVTSTTETDVFRVLVYHRTEGFRHDSIEAGIAAIEVMGEEHGFAVEATQDPETFSGEGLSEYRVIVFLNTSGDVLDRDRELAMEEFVANGGGFVGIHAAADTEYEWPWYGELVGAYFQSHPQPQEAALQVVATGHPLVAEMPESFQRFDEWYDFQSQPGDEVTVLVVIDESTYEGGTMGDTHPISWAHESLGGRSFYTAMGHTVESFSDPIVLTHLLNGILWARGRS